VETLTLKYRDHVISVEKKILSSFPPVMSTAVASSLSVLRECCLTCLAFGDGGPSVSCLHDMSSIAIVHYKCKFKLKKKNSIFWNVIVYSNRTHFNVYIHQKSKKLAA
jgi:hypothetical protein